MMETFRLWLKVQIYEVSIEELPKIEKDLKKLFKDKLSVEEVEMKKDKIRI